MAATFVFRVDAKPETGLGHFTRCTTLASELVRRGCKVVFVTDAPDSHIANLKDAGIGFKRISVVSGSEQDSATLALLLSQYQQPHLVVDGYEFGTEFLRSARKHSVQLTCIDDGVRLAEYPVDVVLDHNPGAETRNYPATNETLKLLGSDYLLISKRLNPEGLALAEAPELDRVGRVLITLGGSDLHSCTVMALHGIQNKAPELNIDVVIGPLAGGELIRSAAEGQDRVTLHEAPSDLSDLIMNADIVVTAGGMTLWEVLTQGVPAIVIILAENQRPHSEFLAELGIIDLIGNHQEATATVFGDAVRNLIADPERRLEMSARATAFCDGKGPARVADALFSHQSRV